MRYTLEAEAFFFNAKTDYLPYYKHFTLTLDEQATSRDLLASIVERNRNFAFPEERLVFRINGLVCTGNETIASIVSRFGTSLRIDPVQTYRSMHCLVINDDDFYQAYERLAPFCDEEDKAYYESLYALHYASVTFDYDKAYAGDAVLALAGRLIEKYPQKADAVRAAVKDVAAMCEYENALFEPFDLQEALDRIKIPVPPSAAPSVLDKLKARVFKSSQKTALPAVAIEGKTVALYTGQADSVDAAARIKAQGATLLTFPKATRRNGRSIIKEARKLALRKAADILLDAFDNGAEVFVCLDADDAGYFIRNKRAIEQAAGREIDMTITAWDVQTFGTVDRAA